MNIRHSLPVIAATIAFGGALLQPAIASAERVWDIEKFDDCTASLDEGMDNTLHWIETVGEYCCNHSGGEWNDSQKKCEAPPGEEAEGTQNPRPPKGQLVPTVEVQPPTVGTPPPVVVTVPRPPSNMGIR